MTRARSAIMTKLWLPEKHTCTGSETKMQVEWPYIVYCNLMESLVVGSN